MHISCCKLILFSFTYTSVESVGQSVRVGAGERRNNCEHRTMETQENEGNATKQKSRFKSVDGPVQQDNKLTRCKHTYT